MEGAPGASGLSGWALRLRDAVTATFGPGVSPTVDGLAGRQVSVDTDVRPCAALGCHRGLLGNSGAGRLLGGASKQGIGVRVGGTASTPGFKLAPSAVTSLLKSGSWSRTHDDASATKAECGNLPEFALDLDQGGDRDMGRTSGLLTPRWCS